MPSGDRQNAGYDAFVQRVRTADPRCREPRSRQSAAPSTQSARWSGCKSRCGYGRSASSACRYRRRPDRAGQSGPRSTPSAAARPAPPDAGSIAPGNAHGCAAFHHLAEVGNLADFPREQPHRARMGRQCGVRSSALRDSTRNTWMKIIGVAGLDRSPEAGGGASRLLSNAPTELNLSATLRQAMRVNGSNFWCASTCA